MWDLPKESTHLTATCFCPHLVANIKGSESRLATTVMLGRVLLMSVKMTNVYDTTKWPNSSTCNLLYSYNTRAIHYIRNPAPKTGPHQTPQA